MTPEEVRKIAEEVAMKPEEVRKIAEEAAMKPKRVQEIAEDVVRAHEIGKKPTGMAIAVFAALLATATMMSHRTHTEEVVTEGERNTQWANYDRKRSVEHMYESDAKVASLFESGEQTEKEFLEKAKAESKGQPASGKTPAKLGTEKIREKAEELDGKLKATRKRAFLYDISELFLEISIVLCSVSLLKDSKTYYQGSFITTAVGVVVGLYGLLMPLLPTGLYPDWLFP